MNNDFEFLKSIYPKIYYHIESAIENSVLDVDIAAFKIRKSLELLIAEIASHEEIILTKSLYENVNILKKYDIIPSQIYKLCDVIRQIGNNGVHSENIAVLDIKVIIRSFYNIVVWFCDKYIPELDYRTSGKLNKNNFIENRFGANISPADKEFFDSFMAFAEETINHIIVKEKLHGFGTINSIEYISFDEYLSFFEKTVREMINYSNYQIGLTPEHSLSAVLRWKEIIRRQYAVSDNYKVNRILATLLYRHTHWYVFE